MSVEYRYIRNETSLDIRGGATPKIVGYAVIFNSLSEELKLAGERRSFRERISRGAFAESLRANDDVLARLDHKELLGRTSNGTLRLYEDGRGLRYEIDPPDTSHGRDAVELIRRRDIPYSSFAFTVPKGGDSWREENGQLIREVRSAKLLDVSPVAKPAYLDTEAALRSLKAAGIGDVLMRMRLELAEASLR